MKQLLANPLSILLYIFIAESFTLRPSPGRDNAVELTLLEKRFLSPARPRSLSFIGPLSSIVGAEPHSSSDQIETDSTQLIQSLLELTRHETDGTKLLIDERESINDIVKSLKALSIENTFTDTNGVDYTSIPLEGEHKLIYIDF
jgi:hypothetical protein